MTIVMKEEILRVMGIFAKLFSNAIILAINLLVFFTFILLFCVYENCKLIFYENEPIRIVFIFPVKITSFFIRHRWMKRVWIKRNFHTWYITLRKLGRANIVGVKLEKSLKYNNNNKKIPSIPTWMKKNWTRKKFCFLSHVSTSLHTRVCQSKNPWAFSFARLWGVDA